MADTRNSCAVCDTRIDPYGREGTRCRRCNEDCPVCQGDIAFCSHPLPRLAPVTLDTCPETGNPRIAA